MPFYIKKCRMLSSFDPEGPLKFRQQAVKAKSQKEVKNQVLFRSDYLLATNLEKYPIP